MTTGRRVWRALGMTVAWLLVASAPIGPSLAAQPKTSGSWLYPNGNLSNTRVAEGSTISATNVATLKQVWSFKLRGSAASSVSSTGSLAANPIVTGGVVYLQDLHSNVYAIALSTGRLEWEYRVDRPERSGPGPNGVAVADGVVYGASPTTVFALNAHDGRRVWVDKSLLHKGQGTFGIQPQVADGRVYLASQYGSGAGGGILLALSAKTGKRLWTFNTVLRRDRGVSTLGAGTGGAWETPLVGTDGSVTYGIGNPYQSLGSAIDYPSRQLYTDSDVSLDAATGRLRWYYQGVSNDFLDHDMQASPMSASVDGVPVVIGGGKMGYVYEMNALTGRLIWKTPVGEHNRHDNASLQMLEHKHGPTLPVTFIPGSLGGILTNMAIAGGSVYVVTCNLGFKFTSLNQVDGTPSGAATGEIEALNLATGRVEWDTHVKDLPLGAATVSKDLVMTVLAREGLVALNRQTGGIVYHRSLPSTVNAPIAIAGNTVLVPAGAIGAGSQRKGDPQLLAFRVS